MAIAMAVLFGEKLFYFSFPIERQIKISENAPADLTIPGLGLSVYVSWEREAFHVNTVQNDYKRTITTTLNKPAVIDSDRKIALFFRKNRVRWRYFSLILTANIILDAVRKSHLPEKRMMLSLICLLYPDSISG